MGILHGILIFIEYSFNYAYLVYDWNTCEMYYAKCVGWIWSQQKVLINKWVFLSFGISIYEKRQWYENLSSVSMARDPWLSYSSDHKKYYHCWKSKIESLHSPRRSTTFIFYQLHLFHAADVMMETNSTFLALYERNTTVFRKFLSQRASRKSLNIQFVVILNSLFRIQSRC